jgi:hypothetical protein
MWRKPITGIAGCCARAASGHAAALPRSAMKLRRLMQNRPSRTKPTKGQRYASQQNWPAIDAVGQSGQIATPATRVSCPNRRAVPEPTLGDLVG